MTIEVSPHSGIVEVFKDRTRVLSLLLYHHLHHHFHYRHFHLLEPEQLLELWSGVAAASMCELLDPQHFVEERICQREELDGEGGYSQ